MSDEQPKKKPLVVCVDDDPDLLAAVVRALRPLPIEIVSTESPIQALDYVGTRDVAVLVSDVEMPEMTGLELTAAARRVRPETVRVLMTGRQSLEIAVEGINQGEIFRYVQKPFVSAAMRKTIEEALAYHLKLAETAGDRERAHLREQLRKELELEYPGITDVTRTSDGVYLVGPVPPEAIAGVGLDPLAVLAHRLHDPSSP